MAKTRDLQSETEAKPVGRTTKSKNALAQAAQQEYLARHINSNGPQDRIKLDPVDFSDMPEHQLNEYKLYYKLNLPECDTIKGDILNSEIGKKTLFSKKQAKLAKFKKITKVDRRELAGHIRNHFQSLPVKENEIVTNFLYKVRNEERDFKLSFN